MVSIRSLGHLVFGLVLSAVFFAGVAWIAEHPMMRWGSRWHVPIWGETGPVDVAIGGSSRANRGVYGPYLADDLRDVLGTSDPVVYNLGVAGHGTDAQILAMLDLLERREVKYLFYQVDELRRNRLPTHRNLQAYGRMWDILFTPIPDVGLAESLTHRIQLVYLRLSLALDECLALALRPTNCILAKPVPVAATTHDLNRPRGIRFTQLTRRIKVQERRGTYFLGEPRKWRFDRGPDQRTDFYLKLLLAAAERNGTKVILMDFPKFEWPELDETSARRVEARYNADLLRFTRDELLSLANRGYGDFGHFNLVGEAAARAKIVEYIRADMSEGSE